LETYTQYKKQFLEEHKDKQVGAAILGEYIDRLEYELKVIKEM
jgi:DNA polymerase III alpha subunit